MILGLESITINRSRAARLANFYKEKVGLKFSFEAEMGRGQKVFGFGLKNADLYIVSDSKLSAKNADKGRALFSLEVADLQKEIKRMEKAGVKTAADFYHLEGYGWIAPYADPDGNAFRLVQVKES